MTAALGLMMVGALNLISVAFAVLFVGLGVDFGIQFAVRYRSERFKHGDLYAALGSTAEKVGAPLTLAAAAIAAGFLSFFPTDYKGVSELGQIAGMGMLIAYVTSVTVLPALLTILHPPGEEEAIGYRVLAPVDRFLERHRIPVIAGTLLVAIGGCRCSITCTSTSTRSICAARPSNRSRRSSTCGPIRRSAPTRSTWCCRMSNDVSQVAERLRKIPEVDKVTTIADFVPDGQERKLALDPRPGAAVADAAEHRGHRASADRCAEHRGAEEHRRRADASWPARRAVRAPTRPIAWRRASPSSPMPPQDKRDAADTAFVVPLRTALDGLRDYLQAGR